MNKRAIELNLVNSKFIGKLFDELDIWISGHPYLEDYEISGCGKETRENIVYVMKNIAHTIRLIQNTSFDTTNMDEYMFVIIAKYFYNNRDNDRNYVEYLTKLDLDKIKNDRTYAEDEIDYFIDKVLKKRKLI